MRFSHRQLLLVTLLAAAALVAGVRFAHGQTPIPSAIEFTSTDHAIVATYRICFYPTATATTATRCNDVPVSAVVSQGGAVYRIPRAAWQTGLPAGTNLFPRIAAVDSTSLASTEAAPTIAPFSFRLPPAGVTAVTLVP